MITMDTSMNTLPNTLFSLPLNPRSFDYKLSLATDKLTVHRFCTHSQVFFKFPTLYLTILKFVQISNVQGLHFFYVRVSKNALQGK